MELWRFMMGSNTEMPEVIQGKKFSVERKIPNSPKSWSNLCLWNIIKSISYPLEILHVQNSMRKCVTRSLNGSLNLKITIGWIQIVKSINWNTDEWLYIINLNVDIGLNVLMIRKRCYSIVVCNNLFWPFLSWSF